MAITFDFYVGWTQAELEIKLRTVQEQLDGFVSATGAGSTSLQRQQRESMEKTITRIYRSLNLRDPETYPLAKPQKRSRTRYVL